MNQPQIGAVIITGGLIARLKTWWRARECRRTWHDWSEWQPVNPERLVDEPHGPYLQFRLCQRCGVFDELRFVEDVVIVMRNGQMKLHTLAGPQLWDTIRVPVLEQPFEAVMLGEPGMPLRFGAEVYHRSRRRDTDGRVIFS